MSFTPYNLLRRTFLVVAAAAAIVSTPTLAQQVKKSEDGSVLCTAYTGISVQPSGGIAITGCSGSSTPVAGAAGTFTVSAVPALAWNVTNTTAATITRTGGTTGSVTVTFDRGGLCGPAPLTGDSVTFADGVTTMNATMRTPNMNTTCTITLTSVTVASGSPSAAPAIGSPSSANIVVNTTGTAPSTPPPPPPTTGAFNCPATPVDATSNFSLTWGGGTNGFLYLKSGQIGYTTLPAFSSYGGTPQSESANVAGAITTGSAPQGTVEVSINHCPGVIDTNGTYTQGVTGGKCYTTYPMDQSVHNLPWFEAVGKGGAATTDSWANAYGICEAYATNGPWYVNVRYNYAGTGPGPGGTYDMAFQWNWSYFNP